MTEFDYWVYKIAWSMYARGIASCFVEEEVKTFMGVPEMYRKKLPEAVTRRLKEMRQQNY